MLIVQKYGGSSVANNEKLLNVANRIARTAREGHSVVVVVSAQGKTTDYLIGIANELNTEPSKREMDALLTTGEQKSMALLTITLQAMGIDAISLTGIQAGLITTSDFGNARIISIDPGRIYKELYSKKVVIVAGFQGRDNEENITTLGRGGSDTTAVALAAVLKADRCDIYSDVDGVYTADPKIVADAKKLNEISYDEMLELASLGAKVLNNRAVEMAKKYNVVIMSGSSFNDLPGTYVKEETEMEDVFIKGIAGDKNIAMITVLNLENKPEATYKIFSLLAKEKISVDIIVQGTNNINKNDLSFTVKRGDLKKSIRIFEDNKENIGATGIKVCETCAKVSAVGAGMINNPGVASAVFEALYESDIHIYLVTTSEIKISAVIDEDKLELAMNAIHKKFEL